MNIKFIHTNQKVAVTFHSQICKHSIANLNKLKRPIHLGTRKTNLPQANKIVSENI